MNILLFGAPGAGKGTQSALLVRDLGMAHIGTGDLFRNAIKSGSPLGLKAKSFMDAGQLVPDSITIGLVDETLDSLNGRPFILDGFPRTLVQAEALDKLLGEKGMRLDKVLFLDVPNDQLLSRLTGRRVCGRCGAVYHVDSQPPRVAGTCDVCGSQIVQRSDDKVEVVGQRLEAYKSNTAPLRDFYQKAGKLVAIDGTGAVEDIYGRIKQVIDSRSSATSRMVTQ